jgi:transposase-like protein
MSNNAVVYWNLKCPECGQFYQDIKLQGGLHDFECSKGCGAEFVVRVPYSLGLPLTPYKLQSFGKEVENEH